MRTALVDSNNIVKNFIELRDQDDLPPLPDPIPVPVEPVAPRRPTAESTPDEIQIYFADLSAHFANLKSYGEAIQTYHLNFQLWEREYREANKWRYTPPEGLTVQQVNYWVQIGQSVDTPEQTLE